LNRQGLTLPAGFAQIFRRIVVETVKYKTWWNNLGTAKIKNKTFKKKRELTGFL